jgi:hypothetical protein
MFRASLAAIFLFACASFAAAQTEHAPDGGTSERIQSVDITTKAGAPFRATVVTTWKRRLEDGTETTIYNHRTVARDSTGRVFQERRAFDPDGLTKETMISELDFYDPGREELTVCKPFTRQCMVWKRHFFSGDAKPLPAKTEFPNGYTVTREALGEMTSENLTLTGSREVSSNPRQGKSEPSIRELWYSARLGINIITKRFEPLGGAQDISVQQIQLSEPDAGLFQLPEGYQVVQIPAPPQQAVGVQGWVGPPPHTEPSASCAPSGSQSAQEACQGQLPSAAHQ